MTDSSSLSADLGRLADPAGPAPYDDVRLALLDAVVTAKGQGGMPHAVWSAAYEGAVRSLRIRVLGDAEAGLRAAAEESRLPAKRLDALLPDAEVADGFLQRLLAEGMSLERLENAPDDAQARRARALALASAWEGAARIAASEASRWRLLAGQVAAWRRRMRGLWIAVGGATLLALVVAGWLGGQWPAPEWFAPVRNAFWSVPWP